MKFLNLFFSFNLFPFYGQEMVLKFICKNNININCNYLLNKKENNKLNFSEYFFVPKKYFQIFQSKLKFLKIIYLK